MNITHLSKLPHEFWYVHSHAVRPCIENIYDLGPDNEMTDAIWKLEPTTGSLCNTKALNKSDTSKINAQKSEWSHTGGVERRYILLWKFTFQQDKNLYHTEKTARKFSQESWNDPTRRRSRCLVPVQTLAGSLQDLMNDKREKHPLRKRTRYLG